MWINKGGTSVTFLDPFWFLPFLSPTQLYSIIRSFIRAVCGNKSVEHLDETSFSPPSFPASIPYTPSIFSYSNRFLGAWSLWAWLQHQSVPGGCQGELTGLNYNSHSHSTRFLMIWKLRFHRVSTVTQDGLGWGYEGGWDHREKKILTIVL